MGASPIFPPPYGRWEDELTYVEGSERNLGVVEAKRMRMEMAAP